MKKKLAVVLFNLGGPDGPDSVQPFLFNLFRDPAIIGLPAPARYALAALISTTRKKSAQANYAIMGGGSPLLPETKAQAQALEAALSIAAPELETRIFIAMRYWNPRAKATAAEVAAFAPDEIVLLPLYPQFSTTTSASSLKDWAKVYRGPGVSRVVCCYPTQGQVVAAHAAKIAETWEAAGRPENVRLLFSAHGLPEKVIKDGDPYQAQVEATAAAVAALLPDLPDWQVCYQSKVGPLAWIGPSTEDAIRQAKADGRGVLLTPIAFVSEHVETLVELDHEYAEIAHEIGCAPYLRVPALGVTGDFIDGLKAMVLDALDGGAAVAPAGGWSCPAAYGKCACKRGMAA